MGAYVKKNHSRRASVGNYLWLTDRKSLWSFAGLISVMAAWADSGCVFRNDGMQTDTKRIDRKFLHDLCRNIGERSPSLFCSFSCYRKNKSTQSSLAPHQYPSQHILDPHFSAFIASIKKYVLIRLFESERLCWCYSSINKNLLHFKESSQVSFLEISGKALRFWTDWRVFIAIS